MAATSSGPSAISSSSYPTKRDQLYDYCATIPGALFNQEDLENLHIARDTKELMQICQELVSNQLFQLLQWDGDVCWKARPQDIATKLTTLSRDELLVYQCVESLGTTGIWTRAIRAKTNLHDKSLNKAIKSLETSRLIKSIRNVKNPSRKTYMLYHLVPSEDIAGGPWHDENGEFDIDLINTVADLIWNYVHAKSWVEAPRIKGGRDMADAIKRRKDAVAAAAAAQQTPPTSLAAALELPPSPRFKPALGPSNRVLIPYPPGYRGYPNLPTISDFVRESGVVMVEIHEADLKHLLDNLVYDGRLERMGVGGHMYRSVRPMEGEEDVGPGNGLAEAPCGRCPVFVLCEEGGPVNARNCVYFEEWLKT
ncbi:hypothetical protein W97_06625 [Coniosporium apollinis CBS 100218]|uniref:DNA-directed RNA polymerase III subunit RPC6 n=1 Tax=Coniosporium apollinis (strain CBS 100218) TaxID=1168221 RepID=R7YZN5_CONA1|nr:uncharacterized protein W97_06625 [Coniosporium apollinis CBS 100218]EON67372.1 hypothetical protein W97_06625 [Coniosporium apollinis CBS 100218]